MKCAVSVGITKKTQVIKGELNPVWNEVYTVRDRESTNAKFTFVNDVLCR